LQGNLRWGFLVKKIGKMPIVKITYKDFGKSEPKVIRRNYDWETLDEQAFKQKIRACFTSLSDEMAVEF